MAAAASGRLDAAEAELSIALEHHADLPMPIELGRTLMLLGRVRRRQRRKRFASEAFVAACEAFASARAAGWESAARRELDRIGFRSSSVDELTPTEWEVARLAASGMTNRQVADAMVLSPKTTDGALTRVYTKLGIHSRAELGAWIARDPSRQKNGVITPFLRVLWGRGWHPETHPGTHGGTDAALPSTPMVRACPGRRTSRVRPEWRHPAWRVAPARHRVTAARLSGDINGALGIGAVGRPGLE